MYIYLLINNNRQQKRVLLIGQNSQRQTLNYIGTSIVNLLKFLIPVVYSILPQNKLGLRTFV